MMELRRWVPQFILLVLIVLVFGCLKEDATELADLSTSSGDDGRPTNVSVERVARTWRDVTLTDIKTNLSFRISDFVGRKVLIESFALWCPSCLSEQRHLEKLKQELGDDIVIISLDTDINEERSQVFDHIQKWGFDWLFAISPKELTDALIDDFGLEILDAKRAPVILVCEDQSSSSLLRMGVKPVEDLKNEIDIGCQD
jgi:thiol-disulfide isomerase/thioredoxin